VVDKVGERMKLSWGPDEFIERFGKELCCKDPGLLRLWRKRLTSLASCYGLHD
jgi:hypothetical protein